MVVIVVCRVYVVGLFWVENVIDGFGGFFLRRGSSRFYWSFFV